MIENIKEPGSSFIASGRKWSKRDIYNVLGMLEKGKTNKEIAQYYGVSPNAIAHLKIDKELPRRKYHKWTTRELLEIRKLLIVGKSVSYIADLLHVKYNQLERCIKYHKLREFE